MAKKISNDLKEMLKAVKRVEKERGWEKFHLPKNMAMDMVREASEAMEHFVWETNEEILADKEKIREIGKELGDVLHSLLLVADGVGADLAEEFWAKLKEVEERYPPLKDVKES